MRRRSVGRRLPLRESSSTTPSISTCASSAASKPATMLTSVVLPQPERPNSPTTPEVETSIATSSVNPSRRFSARMLNMPASAPEQPLHAPRDELGDQQADQAEREGNRREPRGECIAVGRLQRRVQRNRQRARLSWNVRYEGDDRAELAETRGERSHGARENPRQHERQRDGKKAIPRTGAERARSVLESRVDAFQRNADRAHHQRESHHRRGEGGAGRREDQLNAELLVQPAA